MLYIRFLFALGVLSVATGAGAAQYYVDPGGLDTNDGSLAAPFATIQHALDIAVAGDTVTIGQGNYEEAVLLTASGAQGSPILIQASGPVLLTPPAGATSEGFRIQASYIRLEGIAIAGFDIGMVVSQGSSDIVLNTVSLHDNGAGLFLDRVDSVLVEDSTFENNCTDGLRAVGSSTSLVFRRVAARGNGTACGLKGDGFFVAPEATNVLFEDAIAEANSNDGFDTRSSQTVLRRVISMNNADHGARLERGAAVEGSLIAENTKVGIEASGNWPAAFSIVSSTVTAQPIALLLGPAGQPITVTLSGNILAATGKVVEFQETVSLVEDYDIIFRPLPALPHIVRKLGSTTTASYTGNDINAGVWTTDSGQGGNSIAADPLFVAAGAYPYALRANSPAVDAGPPSGFPAQDLLGATRPYGPAVDVGAYEREGGITFYVSPTGNDSGPGTELEPFLTIAQAAAVAGPGDNVVILAGTYQETVSITRSGLPGLPIEFSAEPGAVLASPVPDTTGGPSGMIVTPGVGFVTIDGLTINGGFRRGIYLRSGAHDIAISRVELVGNGIGILVEGASGVSIDNVYAHDNCSHGVSTTLGAQSVSVRASISDSNGFCGSDGDGFHTDTSSSDVRLDGCSATGNSGDGFDIRGQQVWIGTSTARQNLRGGFKLVSDGVVENCLSVQNGTVGLELTGEVAGADLRVASSTFASNSIGVLLGPAGQPATVFMINNILAGSGKLLEYQDTVSLTEDYDLFFRDVGSLPHIMKKQGAVQLASYNAAAINDGSWAAAGGGSNSIAADPRFVAAGDDPYQLRIDSPALDSGLATEAPAADIAGTTRPQISGVDRGAYERPAGLSATYYVSPSGGASGKGDMADPFGSINLALNLAAPGDTVVLLPGTYQEAVRISEGGRSGSPVVLLADQGPAIIEGTGQGTGITIGAGVGYVEIDGVTVEGFDTGVRAESGSHDLTLRRLRVRVSVQVGVEMIQTSGVVVDQSEISDNCNHGVEVAAGSSDVSIIATEASRNGASCARASDGFHISSLASNVSFVGCKAADNAADGFDARGSGMFLAQVQAWDNGDRGIKVEQDAQVENALLVGNRVGIELTGAVAGGDLQLRNSTVFGASSYGLLIGAGRQPVTATIINSIVAGSSKSMEYQQASTIVEHHNLLYRTPATASHIIKKNGSVTVQQFNANQINDGSWTAYSGQGQGTKAADPQFAASEFGDFSLRAESPAVDVGDGSEAPAVDLLGRSRPLGLGVDLGAIERPPPISLYVAPGGSDQNPGTAQAPFASLQRAADLTGPGYEVIVEAGTYQQTLLVTEAGAPGSPISFLFQPGARLEPPQGITGATAITLSSRAAYVEIQGPEIAPGFGRGIWAEAGSHDLLLFGVKVTGAGEGLVLEGVENVSVGQALIERSCDAGVSILGASRAVAISDTRSIDNGVDCTGRAAGFFAEAPSADITFSLCQAIGNTGSGFDLGASQVAVLRSMAQDNGNLGIRSSGDTRVENALVTGNSNIGIVSTGDSPAVEIVNSTIADNGGGVLVTAGSATIVNAIVAGTNKAFEFQDGVSITGHHNIFFRAPSAAAHIVIKQGAQVLTSYNGDDINGGRWQAETGNGEGTMAVDPAFGNPAIGVYSLRAFSPGVNTGSAAQAPALDLDGNLRPLGAGVDIGAYERAVTGGATYVVSPDGSDSGDGSDASPWRSLSRALSQAGPGDTIRIKAGSYAEAVTIPFGGSPGDPLVIEAEPGAVLGNPDPAQSLVGITVQGTAANLEIKGIEITGGFDRGVWLETGASAIVLSDLNVHGNLEGIVIEGASTVAIDGGSASGNCSAGVRIRGGAQQVTVLGTVSERNGVECGKFGSGFIAESDTAAIDFEGAIARGNSQNGFDVKARGASFFGVVAEDNGSVGIRVEHGAIAENVLVFGNGNVGVVVADSDADGTTLDLVNGTIANNTVGVLVGASVTGPVSVSLVNSIIAGDGKLLEYQQSALLTEHHNLYFRTPATAAHIVRKDGGATIARYTAVDINGGLWQAESGLGDGSLAGDPRFIDPDGGLFWLRADSPGVDSGWAAAAPATDISGRGRPLGAEVDRGAYERSSRGGGTYYVAVGGSDTNDGSADSPYATLQRAVDLAAPGDTIVLRSGIHSMGARVEVGGDELASITVQGEAGAVLQGVDTAASLSAISLAPGVGFIELRGLAIQGHWLAGVIAEPGSHDLLVANTTVSDSRQGIVLQGALRVQIESSTMVDNCDAGLVLEGGSSEVTLRQVTSRDNGNLCGDLADGLFADATTSQVSVEDSTFTGNSEEGVDLRGRSSSVKRVDASRNGGSGIRIDDGLVENCLAYGNAGSGITSVGRDDGAAVAIYNCTLHDNQLPAQFGEAVRDNVLSVTLRNSIFSGSRALVEFQQGVSLSADYNLYFRSNAFMPHIVVKELWRTVETYNASDINSGVWTSAGGQGANSRSGDPLFVDPDNAVFELHEASLAVDLGSVSGAPPVDMKGRARPLGGGIDVGALEHVPCGEGGSFGCRPLPPPPPPPGGSQRVSFARQDPRVGAAPMGGALADFDGDGHLDLAVANSGEDTVYVLMGNGQGRFRSVVTFPVGVRPRGLAAGDLNGDGMVDLAIANQTSDDVYLMAGDGTGRFALISRLSANQAPVAAAIADLNRDGLNDLVVVNMDSDDVSVFLYQAGTGMDRPVNYRTGSGPLHVDIADLNNDGNPDLAVANRKSDNVTVLLGDGSGRFGLPVHYPAGDANRSVAIADFNADGNPDLAVASRLSNGASVLLGDGSGLFLPATTIPTGSTPNSVASGDMNSDGITDLIVADTGDDQVSLLLSQGGAGFASPVPLAVGDHPSTVLVGDLNEDGNRDLVTINREARTVTVLLGDGAGGVLPESQEIPTGAGPVAIASGDTDQDGEMDAVVANADGGSVTLVRKVGGLSETVTVPLPGTRPAGLVLDDFNGDGLLDLAVTDEQGGRVKILLGDGSSFVVSGSANVGRRPVGIVAADFNQDSLVDLAVANSSGRTVSILLGDGSGGFVGGGSVRVGLRPYALAVLDANQDGVLDLAVIHRRSHALRLRLGNGDGTFRRWRSSSVAKLPTGLVMGDFDGDGRDDLAVTNSRFNFLTALMSRGRGRFRRRKVRAFPKASAVAADDFDGDGKLDLAVTDEANGKVMVLLGGGNGTFELASSYAVGAGPSAVEAADVNGDGRPDLLVVNRQSETLSVLTNYSP